MPSECDSREFAEINNDAYLQASLILIVSGFVSIVLSYSLEGPTLHAVYAITSLAAAAGIYTLHASRMRWNYWNPVSTFSVVWLALVPTSSISVPLMSGMTQQQVRFCALATVCFAFGVLAAQTHRSRQHGRSNAQFDALLGKKMQRLAVQILVLSIAALAANIALEGRIAILSTGSEERKAVAQFLGYPLFASSGSVSFYIYARLRHFSPQAVTLLSVWLILQILNSQRFVAIVAMALLLSGLMSQRNLGESRIRLRHVIGAITAAISIFFAVAQFRGGEDDFRRNFVQTGVYSGDAASFFATEPLRYIGMSQRNMTRTIENPELFPTSDVFTLSPLLAVVGDPPAGLGVSTYGYTASNFIAYLHADFGDYWWLAIFLMGLFSQAAFARFLTTHTFGSGFFWTSLSLAILVSFFAWLHAFVYWIVLFPLLLTAAETWWRRTLRKSTTDFHLTPSRVA